MRVESIAGIDLADLDAMGTVSKLGEPFDINVRHRERSAGSSYVGASVDPRAYVLVIQPAGASDMNQDRILAILNVPHDDELIVRAVRPETPTTVVVARAAVSQLDIRGGGIYATLIAADPYWYAETPRQKSVTVEADLINPIPVAGGKRVQPKLRFRPTVQRTTGTANHGAKLRRRFTVTNNDLTTSLYRLPLRIDLGETDDEVAASKMLSSGNDVRVFHEGREIPRTLVSHNINGTTCKLWLILPSLGPGESTVFEVVYGNAQAGAPPVLAYPDLPPFTLSTSTNALWVYEGAQVIGSAGKGGWHLNQSAAVPSLVDFEVPGAWRRALTLPAGPNRDDVSQRRWTSYIATGTKYMAMFDAVRYRGGVAALQDEGLADGVVLYHPLGISNVNVGLFIENRDSLTGGGGTATGKVMILGRDTGAQDWITLLENTTVMATTLAAANYAPAAPVRQLAFAVWPFNEREIPDALGADRFCQARWNTAVQVTIDTTDLSIVETQVEEACYEVDLHVRTGSAPESDLIPPTHHLYLGGGNSDRARRLTMRLNEQLVIDCDRRTAQIWNTALTSVVDDVSVYAVAARKAGATGPQTFDLFADPEWLPLDPDYIPFANASFEEGLDGWVEDHVTPEAIALTDVPGMAFWHKADAIAQADNTAVASWTDSSGNGRHAVNATGTEQPTLQTNEVNGLPVVRFDGVDNDLAFTAHGLTKPCTLFIVVKVNAGNAANDRILDATNLRVEIGGTGTNDFLMNGGSSFQYSTDTQNNATHLHTLIFRGTGNSAGGFDGTHASGAAGTGAIGATITYGATGITNHITMDLCEVVAYNGELSTEDFQKVEGSLALKWGISANLPGAHPYDDLVDATLDTATAVSELTFFSAAGQPGSDDGEFTDLRGLAVDSQGRVYAVDEDNHRIERFSPSLVFQRKWGALGTGNGQLSSPSDGAIDALDRPWIVDRGNARLERFSGEGAYQTQFRPPRYGYALKVQGTGSGNGQFDSPRGLAVDANGDVWVADDNNDRVQRLSSILAYEAQFGSAGSGNGQFSADNGAFDVAIDTDGHPWVVDRGNNRVQEFDDSGGYLSQFGSPGVGDGQFSVPQSIDIKTSSGRVYVADTGNHRIQYFTNVPAFEGKWGAFGTADGQFTTPVGVAVNQTSGDVYVIDQGNWRIQRFSATGSFLGKVGTQGNGDAQFQIPRAIAVNPATGNVYVVDSTRDDVQEFSSALVFQRRWGVSGTGDGQFGATEGIAFNSDGTILYVSDLFNPDRVQRFDLADYTTLAVRKSTGQLYVVDSANGRVLQYSEGGVLETTFGSEGSSDGQMSAPDGIAVNQDSGDVYVVDAGNDRIQRFTSAGVFVDAWGTAGVGNGQFGSATRITVHPTSGNVFVADSTRDDIQEFTADGTFVQTIGSAGVGDGQFSAPSGLAFDDSGFTLYVADSTQERIQRFVSGAFVPVGTITARLTIIESSAPASAVISRLRSEDRRPVGDQPAIGPLFVASTNSADLQVYPCIFWYDRLDGLLSIDTQVTNPLAVSTYAAQGGLFRPPDDAYWYRVGAEIVDLAGGSTGQLLIDDFRLWPDSPALSLESDWDTPLGTLVWECEWREAYVQ